VTGWPLFQLRLSPHRTASSCGTQVTISHFPEEALRFPGVKSAAQGDTGLEWQGPDQKLETAQPGSMNTCGLCWPGGPLGERTGLSGVAGSSSPADPRPEPSQEMSQ